MKLAAMFDVLRQRYVKYCVGWHYKPEGYSDHCYNCVACKMKPKGSKVSLCDRFKFPTSFYCTCRHYAPQKYVTSPDLHATLGEILGEYNEMLSNIKRYKK